MKTDTTKETEPMFFAVIGAYVRYDKRLNSNHKVLYAEITALTYKSGFCYASNSHLAEMFDVHRNTISGWVSKLKECGHIKYFIEKKADGNFIRKIYLVNNIPLGAKSSDEHPSIPEETPLNPRMDTPKSEDGQIHISNKISNEIKNKDKHAIAPLKEKSSYKIILERHYSLYEAKLKRKYNFAPVDGVAIKNIMRGNYTLDEILMCLKRYFDGDNKFFQQQGYTLKYFQSAISGLILGDIKTGSSEDNRSQAVKELLDEGVL